MAKELQRVDNQEFALAVLEMPGLKEAVQANLAGMGHVKFERIKIPAGGGLAFEVLDDNGEPTAVSEITGVIVDRYPVNAYWPDAFSGENIPPQCTALDGQVGVGDPGGPCATCPHNQWGSDLNGRGKACKNLHRVYIMAPDEALPRLITLPPTSLGNFNSYLVTLTKRARPFYSVLTKVKLEKASNKNGISYSRATFSRAGDVPADKIVALKAYIDDLKPLMRAEGIIEADYSVEEADIGSEPF